MKLIKYATSHCPMCQAMEKQLDLVIMPHETINVDEPENQHIAVDLGIRNVPVTILWDNDEIIHRWQGVVKAEVINEKITEYENL